MNNMKAAVIQAVLVKGFFFSETKPIYFDFWVNYLHSGV